MDILGEEITQMLEPFIQDPNDSMFLLQVNTILSFYSECILFQRVLIIFYYLLKQTSY